MATGHEELSGNPNFQLGGLLSPWPDDSDRHWLDGILSVRVDHNQAVLTCATNRGDTAAVHVTCVAPRVLRLTLCPPGVERTPRQTHCLGQDDLPRLPLALEQDDAFVRIRAGELLC